MASTTKPPEIKPPENVADLHMPIPAGARPPQHEKGFPVLKLPKRGEDLFEGRQYELSPVARAYIEETWGFVLPRVVECLHKKRPPMRYAMHALNLETGEARWSVSEEPATEATFSAWMANSKLQPFTLNLEFIAEREHASKGSHKAREYAEKDFNELSKSAKEKITKIPREKPIAIPVITETNVLALLNL